MASNYYCLVASLKEYTLDADTKGLDVPALRQQIAEELSSGDCQLLQGLYTFFDVQNLINLLVGRSGQFSLLGNLPKEQLERTVEAFKSSESRTSAEGDFSENDTPLPPFITRVLGAYKATGENADEFTDINTEKSIEYNLWSSFYRSQSTAKNPFIRAWFDFDRDLRNLCAGYAARAQGRDIASELVGDGAIVEALTHSNASDFGLKNEVSYMESIVQTLDTVNLLEKERKLDLLRWNRVEELTTFDYFNVNKILGYLIKLNIIYRWMSLDKQVGEQMFARLVSELTKNEVLDRFTAQVE